MIQKIFNWLKRVIGLFQKTDIKRALNVDAAISSEMMEAVNLWDKMYNNASPWLGENVQSLNLASAIASEVAMLTTIEAKIQVSGSPRADYLDAQLQACKDTLREKVEYGCAKGGLVLKPYVQGNKISIDCIQADNFLPVVFDSSGHITSAVFFDQIRKGNTIYTRLEYHSLENSGYIIKNLAFRSLSDGDLGQQIDLSAVDQWADLEPEVKLLNVSIPMFAYFRVPQANTIDSKSPLGVSVYSRATDLIKEADKQYSRLLWEFKSGERALYLGEGAFRPDPKTKKVVLPDRRLYRMITDIGSKDNELFKDWTPTIREQSIINGLNAILIKIEDVCGLARGTLSNPQSEARTATELKILRQRSYATVADIQKSLQAALEDLTAAMDVWCTLYNLTPAGKYEMSFEWDDSIIVDSEKEQAIWMAEVTAGIISKIEYLKRRYGVTEEQAQEMLPKAESDPFGGDG